jgi:hypothetical protein
MRVTMNQPIKPPGALIDDPNPLATLETLGPHFGRPEHIA